MTFRGSVTAPPPSFLAEGVPDLAVLVSTPRSRGGDHVTGPRELDVVHELEAAGPPRHDDDAVGEGDGSERSWSRDEVWCLASQREQLGMQPSFVVRASAPKGSPSAGFRDPR